MRSLRRSKHNLSHYKLLSMNQGDLVPISCIEVLPGDTFRHATNALVRLSPLNTPVMHPNHVVIHHWYCPARVLWDLSKTDNWEAFITGGPDGENASVYPTITSPGGGFAVGSLADYLGIPTGIAGLSLSALQFRMYNYIWNNFYRDEQLQTERAISFASGADSTTDTSLAKVCWEKDIYTAARPEPQLGPQVILPLTGNAPVDLVPHTTSTSPMMVRNANTGAVMNNQTIKARSNAGGGTIGALANGGETEYGVLDPNGRLEADMSGVASFSIRDLRLSSAIQRFMERMNTSGSRYVEYLQSMGVKSSDARLQLPEYLGGGSQTVQYSEVLQTAEGTDPVGELKGHGIAAMRTNQYERFFEEHGFVMTLMYIKPKTMYVQGLEKQWSRRTKFDWYTPEFEHVGQTEVRSREVYADGTSGDNDIFGYNDINYEYRGIPSTVAGEFRTSVLNMWHQARTFVSRPVLNASFVAANPTDRIFASATNDVIYVMARHNIHARRLVAKRAKAKLM